MAQHLLTDLHSDSVRGAGSIVSDWTRTQRRPLQVHHGDCPKPGAEVNLNQRHGRPRPHFDTVKTSYGASGAGSGNKADSSNFVNRNKWVHGKFSCRRAMARIFIRLFSIEHNRPLYSESGKASQPKNLQRRVLNPAEEI